MTLLSPRHEFGYRFHDALLDLPWVAKRYTIEMLHYSPGDEAMPDLSGYDVDGIITALDADIEDMSSLSASSATVVNLATSSCSGVVSLGICPESVARVVIRHALGAGYESLVFLPTLGMQSQEQQQGEVLESFAREAGLSYWQTSVGERPLGVSLKQWMGEHEVLIERIASKRKRTLYYTFHDWRAVTILGCCRVLGRSVPQDVGILGRGNSLDAQGGWPRLSSITLPYLGLASRAAEMVRDRAGLNQWIDCGEVAPRESTVGAQKEGNLALKLAEMIRVYGVEGITVDQLAQLAGTSRSSLERNYRLVHGEAPSAALKRVRMQRVEHLLKSTDLTIRAIAEMVGFSSTRSFFTMFEREHGMPPGRWRGEQSGRV